MMQMLFLVLLVVVATLSGAEAWGEKSSHDDWSKDCPYSKECYQATPPPPFVCKNMKPDEW